MITFLLFSGYMGMPCEAGRTTEVDCQLCILLPGNIQCRGKTTGNKDKWKALSV